MFSPFLLMGRFGRPHGIRGDLTADWFGEGLPLAGQTVFLGDSAQADTVAHYVVRAVQKHRNRLILSLESVLDRNAAMALTGKNIFLHRSSVDQPGEDEAFLADLPGCLVFLENGDCVGLLDHVEYLAGQPIWIIKVATGREILFPGQPEFIRTLAVAQKEIVIAPPEGLLDIYNA